VIYAKLMSSVGTAKKDTLMNRHENLAHQIHLVLSGGIPNDFSGLGVVIYRGRFMDLPVSPLLQKSEVQPSIDNDVEIANLLVSISRYSDVKHDGFHFIHEQEGLTHLCQFVSPTIPSKYEPTQYGVGARHRSAELTSLMNSISAVIVVERNGYVREFVNGIYRTHEYEA
jgi:hypothetical protein